MYEIQRDLKWTCTGTLYKLNFGSISLEYNKKIVNFTRDEIIRIWESLYLNVYNLGKNDIIQYNRHIISCNFIDNLGPFTTTLIIDIFSIAREWITLLCEKNKAEIKYVKSISRKSMVDFNLNVLVDVKRIIIKWFTICTLTCFIYMKSLEENSCHKDVVDTKMLKCFNHKIMTLKYFKKIIKKRPDRKEILVAINKISNFQVRVLYTVLLNQYDFLPKIQLVYNKLMQESWKKDIYHYFIKCHTKMLNCESFCKRAFIYCKLFPSPMETNINKLEKNRKVKICSLQKKIESKLSKSLMCKEKDFNFIKKHNMQSFLTSNNFINCMESCNILNSFENWQYLKNTGVFMQGIFTIGFLLAFCKLGYLKTKYGITAKDINYPTFQFTTSVPNEPDKLISKSLKDVNVTLYGINENFCYIYITLGYKVLVRSPAIPMDLCLSQCSSFINMKEPFREDIPFIKEVVNKNLSLEYQAATGVKKLLFLDRIKNVKQFVPNLIYERHFSYW